MTKFNEIRNVVFTLLEECCYHSVDVAIGVWGGGGRGVCRSHTHTPVLFTAKKLILLLKKCSLILSVSLIDEINANNPTYCIKKTDQVSHCRWLI